MKRIALEEHYLTREYLDFIGKTNEASRLLDIGAGRIRMMDEAGIAVQVLCLATGDLEKFKPADGINWAKQVNDALGEGVKQNPSRLAGFASLPLQEPDAAADELERSIRQLGLCGAKISPQVGGEYIDEKKFRPVFARAAKLGVPLFMHPSEPSPDMMKPYQAYPGLSGAMLGFAAVTSLGAMRLVLSGIFDEYPGLTIILGHMGEALPFWLWRLDNKYQKWTKPVRPVGRNPGDYLRDNFYFTTSGMFSIPAFMCSYFTFGAGNILFAVDYPFESNKLAIEFMDSVPICDQDRGKVYHLNAEKLLKLK